MRVGYLVHDLGDAAVARRMRMLVAGGLDVTLVGFARSGPPASVEGVPARCLGRTHDGRMADRAIAVAKALPGFGGAVRDADVLVARNLEMLVLAVASRRGRRVVYECLDIHRLLTGSGRAARFVQWIERRLLRHVDLVLTSSPRFVVEHFDRIGSRAPTLVIENKVLALGADRPRPSVERPRVSSRWTIGWFGMLRCRRSLAMLADIAECGGGAVEVLIAGRPSRAEFPEFEADVAAAPGLRFIGAYAPDDLAELYGAVDFAWAVDYFEEGENSTWLLPNRLYEASAHGVVPIALAGVETGAWLNRHGAGVMVVDPGAEVPELLRILDEAGYKALREAVLAIPEADLVADGRDCEVLALAVAGPAE